MFQNITVIVLELAPFLDHMITPDISARYTVQEALAAMQRLYVRLDTKTLTRLVEPPRYRTWQAQDQWAGLPEEFVAKCAAEMTPVRPKEKTYDENWDPIFVDHF